MTLETDMGNNVDTIYAGRHWCFHISAHSEVKQFSHHMLQEIQSAVV